MSDSRDFSHFVITRFNVPFPSADRPSKCLDGEWLDERMELFER
jgi:hypothetical protein